MANSFGQRAYRFLGYIPGLILAAVGLFIMYVVITL